MNPSLPTRSILFQFLFAALLSGLAITLDGCADKCEDQYCLNGGDCYKGDCECPTGFTGTHCETATGGGGGGGGSAGYNCVSGNCIGVSSNASYGSLAACQASCSSPQTGQLMVWNSDSQPCPAGAGSVISVYVNGTYVGGLGNYYTSAPSCGASGAVTVTLAPGTHVVTGQCGTTTWGPGTINVSAGQCSKFQFY